MMGWFKRHLNWTCVFEGIFTWMLAWFLHELILFFTGMAYLPFPGEPYVAPDPYASYYPITFDFQTMSYVAFIFSIPVFLWILKQKNRSLLYAMFFMPSLFPIPNAAGFVFFFLVPFWLTGWILLLALRNKSAQTLE